MKKVRIALATAACAFAFAGAFASISGDVLAKTGYYERTVSIGGNELQDCETDQIDNDCISTVGSSRCFTLNLPTNKPGFLTFTAGTPVDICSVPAYHP